VAATNFQGDGRHGPHAKLRNASQLRYYPNITMRPTQQSTSTAIGKEEA